MNESDTAATRAWVTNRGFAFLRCPPLLSLLLLRSLLDRSRCPTASGFRSTPILPPRSRCKSAAAECRESRRRLCIDLVEEQSHDLVLVDGGPPGGALQYLGRHDGEIAAPRRDQLRFFPAQLSCA